MHIYFDSTYFCPCVHGHLHLALTYGMLRPYFEMRNYKSNKATNGIETTDALNSQKKSNVENDFKTDFWKYQIEI